MFCLRILGPVTLTLNITGTNDAGATGTGATSWERLPRALMVELWHIPPPPPEEMLGQRHSGVP